MFDDFPSEYKAFIDNIDKSLTKLYSNFTFQYIKLTDLNIKENNDTILNYLAPYKFMTCQISKEKKESNILSICVENKCFFIKTIDANIILKTIKKSNSFFIKIDVNNFSDATKNEEDEVKNFVMHFQRIIKRNKFIFNTIYSIAAYMIRRYFYPSNFFKDSSFFKFNSSIRKNSNQENKIFDILNDEVQENNEYSLTNFQEDEFIKLRLIYHNSLANFFLVMHIESFHVFMMKKMENSDKKYLNEINYCEKNMNHRCFVHFYGFVRNKRQTIGFIYDFMSNGSLEQYMQNNEIDCLFSFQTIIRIFEGIEYLHSHFHIHRDLKPGNILINNDHEAFISDFETIKQIEEQPKNEMTLSFGSIYYASPEQIYGEESNQKISYSTDIYSFGLTIYFILEKKKLLNSSKIEENFDLIKKNDLPNMDKVPDDIQLLIKKCIKYQASERPTLKEIKEILYKYASSFHFVDRYFLIENNKIIKKEEIFNYFFETILLISHFIDKSQLSQKIKSLSDLFNSIKIGELSEILYQIGYIYCQDTYVEKNNKQALKYYLKSSEYNNSNAIKSIGNFYFYGFEFEQSYSNAKEYYERSAKQNNHAALYSLGYLYFNGFGVEKDYIKAKYFYELAVKYGDINALHCLGLIYYNGFGVEKNLEIAKDYFEKAAKRNHFKSIYNLGFFYLEGICYPKNYDKAKEYFEIAAQHNEIDAFNSLAYMYLNGIGVEKNSEKAVEYYKIGVKKNDLTALFYLGNCYIKGQGISQDFEKAKQCFELAASYNDPYSLNCLGVMYLKGQGMNKNYEKAIEYFKKSASFNNPYAYDNLGKMYYYGLGVSKDYARAKYYFEIAIKQNNCDALFNLAILHYKPSEYYHNYKEAKKYFELAAENNHSIAQRYLGKLYFYGIGVEKDYVKAKKSFEKASFSKNPDALFDLGKLYFYGLGTKQNILKAIEFFKLSAKENNPNPLFYLGYIYENGIGIKENIIKAIKYYTKCAEKEQTKYFFNFNEGYEEKIRYNKYFYPANNNLALIYLIHKDLINIEKAKIYIQTSGNNEYPYGQNCYGLYYQYYLKDNVNAEYMYSKASKNNFKLAEFNLGRFYELKGDKEKSFEHYNLFLNSKDEPMKFRNRIIDDEQLEISKVFIKCYANLKVIQYYLNENKYVAYKTEIKKMLITMIFQLLFKLLLQSNSQSFLFDYKTQFLSDFILQYPLFLIDQKFISYDKKWKKFEQKSNKKTIFFKKDFIQETCFNYICEKKKQMNLLSNMLISDECEENFKDEVENIFKQINGQNEFVITQYRQIDDNYIEIQIGNEKDDIERYLIYPADLMSTIIEKMSNIEREINEIIVKIDEILFTKPYSILFGRIKSNVHSHIKEIPPITESFYDGLKE